MIPLHPTPKTPPPTWRCAVAVLALLLAACGAPVVEPPSPTTPTAPLTAPQLEKSVANYLTLAAQNPGSKGHSYLLDAAELLLAESGKQDSLETVMQVLRASSLSRINNARMFYLEARNLMRAGDHDNASVLLSSLLQSAQGLPRSLLAAAHQTRADLLLLQGQPLQSAMSLMQREKLLNSEVLIWVNQQRLWQTLLEANTGEIEETLVYVTDELVSGWFNLALLYMENAADRLALHNTLRQWLVTHRNHPSASLVTATLGTFEARVIERIALLLPQNSRFGEAAQALLDGFVDAHSADSDPRKPLLAIYDYGDNTQDINAWYKRAVVERADIIVGPLGRAAVGKLLQSRLTIPTILLGGTPEAAPKPGIEFTINPERQATGAALRAFHDGHRNAAVLYYGNERGQRQADAFKRTWRALGGTMVVSARYRPQRDNHALIIQRMFHLDQSRQRRNTLVTLLDNENLRYSPRRRRDIDFIFLVSNAENGRLIKPLINFHQGHDLPVYSTSEIFSGKLHPELDADLNGIFFNDMRWMATPNGLTNALRKQLPSRDHRHSGLDRLYALGFDSYGMAFRHAADTDGGEIWPGASANIMITTAGHAARTLNWYVFQEGIPVTAGHH